MAAEFPGSGSGGPPSGAAGGVLGGTYPNPSFAADMATQAELDAVASARQPLDSDLTAVAALAPSNDDVLQRKSGAWANRTVAQLVTDLGLGSVYQPLDSDLTSIAGLATTSFGRSTLAKADAKALRGYAEADEMAIWRGTAGATTWRCNFDRSFAFSGTAAIGATGVMASFAIVLYAGDTITSLAFRSGTVPANTPTNWWFALYDPSLNLLQQTADQTTTAWAANTTKDVALNASVPITTTGIYYAAIMMKATTVININGAAFAAASAGLSPGLVAGQAVKSQTSGSGLTTTAPATIATPTNIVGIAYVEAHD